MELALHFLQFSAKKNLKKVLLTVLAINLLSAYAHAATKQPGPEVIWTPTFYDIQPRTDTKHPVSAAFCLSHTPNTLRTTIDQIKQGIKAENGVYIKYLSYTTTYKHSLGFNTVNAEVWLEDTEGKKIWSSPLWEYQQNLSDTGVTNTVWATPECKGKFIGVSNTD